MAPMETPPVPAGVSGHCGDAATAPLSSPSSITLAKPKVDSAGMRKVGLLTLKPSASSPTAVTCSSDSAASSSAVGVGGVAPVRTGDLGGSPRPEDDDSLEMVGVFAVVKWDLSEPVLARGDRRAAEVVDVRGLEPTDARGLRVGLAAKLGDDDKLGLAGMSFFGLAAELAGAADLPASAAAAAAILRGVVGVAMERRRTELVVLAVAPPVDMRRVGVVGVAGLALDAWNASWKANSAFNFFVPVCFVTTVATGIVAVINEGVARYVVDASRRRRPASTPVDGPKLCASAASTVDTSER